MDFVMTCIRIGVGCAIGVLAFSFTLILILGVVVWLGQLGDKKKDEK